MHKPPLVKLVIFQPDLSAFDRVQHVLRPRHQQPHHGAFFFRHRANDPLRLGSAQKHGTAAGNGTAEPVHFRPGVIKRRNAKEGVVAGLTVVFLFHHAGVSEAAMGMDDRLGEPGGAAGKIDRRFIVLGQRYVRSFTRTV
ncbi:hypothetical protein SDC9_209843 [bioreactor metagenome]|uniref:Uncharacterized protein n=1 Tax=bioreactor metagenome TaxID=1076179 RepID=A0A645JFF6_9ZZZZ